jgi:hypothetical protein
MMVPGEKVHGRTTVEPSSVATNAWLRLRADLIKGARVPPAPRPWGVKASYRPPAAAIWRQPRTHGRAHGRDEAGGLVAPERSTVWSVMR